MSDPVLLTDALRARIGQTASYTAPEPLGRAAIRYFAAAVGDANPLYTDAAYAREHGYDDVIAPPTLLAETNQYVTGAPDADGYLGHSWHLEVPDSRLCAVATAIGSPRLPARTPSSRHGGGSPT